MLILWSGGVDSTLILYKSLIQSNRGCSVRTLSINHPQVAGVKRMKEARAAIVSYLKQRYDFSTIEIDFQVDGKTIDDIKHDGLTQPLLWLFPALMYVDDDEPIVTGDIEGSGVLRHFDKLLGIVDYSAAILGKRITMDTPLLHYSKAEVIKEFRSLDENLFLMTRYCESKKKKPCMKCGSCIVHATALWQLESKLIR